MKKLTTTLLTLLVLLTTSCKITKFQKQGILVNQNFNKEIPFQYVDDLIIVTVEIQSKKYNLVFDTGAELILLDEKIASQINYKSLSKTKVSTSTKSARGVIAELPKISIDEIEFDKTVAVFLDLSGVSNAVGCIDIHGLIGNNVMRKAHWQIDYQNQVIRVTDNFSNLKTSKNAHRLKMNAGSHGNIYFDIKIAGVDTKATFDTGFNGKFQINKTTLLNGVKHKTIKGTLGADASGPTIGEESYAVFKKILVEDFPLQNQKVIFEKGSSSLIGNGFWEHFTLTIDWKNDELIMEPKEAIEKDELSFFEIIPSANYKKGVIEIQRRVKGSKNHLDIPLGTQVLKINDFDVTSFSAMELCDFWRITWKEIKKQNSIKLIIRQGNQEREIEVYKLLAEN